MKVGENNIAPGKFYFDSGYDRYYVEYSFTGKGIISYEYEKVTDWESVKEDAKEAGIVIITAAIITAAVAASGGSASGVAVGVASNAGALATLGGA